MAKPFERVREIISAESDDFFNDGTITYYVNKSIENIVSILVQRERQSSVSLRALDLLREKATFSNISAVQIDDYFTGSDTLPSNFKTQLSAKYGNKTNLRELPDNKEYHLNFGNAIPTEVEGYYNIEGGSISFYLHESPEKDITFKYIKTPTPLTETSEGITQLPSQLENAVLYSAASMAVGQESVKDPEGNVNFIAQMAQQELENSIY